MLKGESCFNALLWYQWVAVSGLGIVAIKFRVAMKIPPWIYMYLAQFTSGKKGGYIFWGFNSFSE